MKRYHEGFPYNKGLHWNKRHLYARRDNNHGDKCSPCIMLVDYSWNVMAQGDAGEGKWRGNWRMEWGASTLHTTSEHGVSSITTADAHTSAASRTELAPPADLNRLVRFAERRNLVSARVPSHFKCSLLQLVITKGWKPQKIVKSPTTWSHLNSSKPVTKMSKQWYCNRWSQKVETPNIGVHGHCDSTVVAFIHPTIMSWWQYGTYFLQVPVLRTECNW